MATYDRPPESRNSDGDLRKVGVEIEFAQLAGLQAAKAVANGLGGKPREVSAHRYVVEATDIGDVTVELDARHAHAPDDEHLPLATVAREALGNIAKTLVPYEVVTPPVPIDRLCLLDRLTASLRDAGAKGTSSSPLYAFGLHLNPEAPCLSAGYLTRLLRAFVLKNAWLRAEMRPDKTRQLLSWAEPYSPAYCARLLAPDYRPSITDLISDYVETNQGRNHDLDMLPLFAHLDEELVLGLASSELIKPRPAFHYRLPDCLVDQEGWTIADDWNRWVAVERLAADGDAIASATNVFFQAMEAG